MNGIAALVLEDLIPGEKVESVQQRFNLHIFISLIWFPNVLDVETVGDFLFFFWGGLWHYIINPIKYIYLSSLLKMNYKINRNRKRKTK